MSKTSILHALSTDEGRRKTAFVYAPLALVSLALIFGPFVLPRLEDLLIFVGGWSNIVLFSGVYEELHNTKVPRVRLLLLLQCLFLALILGFDLDRWLGTSKIAVPEVIREKLIALCSIKTSQGMLLPNIPDAILITHLVTFLIVAFIVIHTLYNMTTKGRPEIWLMWVFILPSLFVTNERDLVSVGESLLANVSAFITKLPVDFFLARGHIYVHLLFIPFLYLTVDSLNRHYLKVARRAINLDVITLIVGLGCCTTGAAWYVHSPMVPAEISAQALFESGSVAAILLIVNWVFVVYVDPELSQKA